MKSIIRTIIIITIVLLAITGCSKGSSNPVQPDTGSSNPPVLRSASGRSLIGVWEIHLRSDVPGAEVRINRTIQSHVHVEGDPDFDVDVDYEPDDPYSEGPEDYNPAFGFRGWAIWRLQITLTNNIYTTFCDVRGIIITNEDALGLHNAYGLTTLWDNSLEEDEANPFMYYGILPPNADLTEEFQVRFTPPDLTLNCGGLEWEGTFPDPEYPEYYIPQDAWINFAVDASDAGYCQEPYFLDAPEATMVFNGDLDDPIIAITAYAEVHDSPPNYVDDISIMLLHYPEKGIYGLPGYEDDWNVTWFPIVEGGGVRYNNL